ncbi:MAG: hypothetical protein ACR2MX_06595 [Cyclobacteriaceae bacterium]
MSCYKSYSFFLLGVLLWSCSKKEVSEGDLVPVDTVGLEMPHISVDTLVETIPEVPIDYYTYKPPQVESAPRNIYNRDSIWVSNYNLIFEPIEEVSLPDYYPDQTTRDSLTSKFPIDILKALAVEKYLLRSPQSQFSRNRDTLKLHLNNGRILALVDRAKRLVYHYENDFTEINFHLIRVQFDESQGYLMINKDNGSVYSIWGRPYFSPSKQKFLTINSDLEEQVSPNGIQLFSFIQGQIKKLWELPIRDWGPIQAKWIGENKLHLQTASIIDSESDVVITTDFQELVLKDP